jgi:hypothetical protein
VIRTLLAALLAAAPIAARAQSLSEPVVPGYLTQTGCNGGLSTCFTPVGGTSPIKGFGTLAVSSSSVLVSTLTAGPNSSAWPTAPGMVNFINAGSSVIYLCPLGGTCSATVGIPMPAATTLPIFNPSTSATAFDASSGTLAATW